MTTTSGEIKDGTGRHPGTHPEASMHRVNFITFKCGEEAAGLRSIIINTYLCNRPDLTGRSMPPPTYGGGIDVCR